MAFVLDASVALAWCFPDESNGHALSILRHFAEDDGVVPCIWHLEVANALVTGLRRNRISEPQIAYAISLLQNLDISVDQPGNTYIFDAAVHLAIAHNLSVYDASYLELAERLKCPLATADAKLLRAAESLHLEVL